MLAWSGSAWACSSAGTGTITGVTAGTDLTGGGTSGNVTLYLDTTKVPQLATPNTFTGNQTVNGNLSATGVVTAASYQIGTNLFGWGSYTNANAAVGYAGNTTMTGGANTGIGFMALSSNTTGNANTASGARALYSNTTGGGNVANGSQALFSNTTGSYNNASGDGALFANTTGQYNTADGYQALKSNMVADNNVAVGFQALTSNVGDTIGDGWYNTAVGSGALYSNNYSSGGGLFASNNTAVGYQALNANTIGAGSTATGSAALINNTTGGNNTASGYLSLYSDTTGWNNTASGMQALYQNTTGTGNTASGFGALFSNTTGNFNMALGDFADVGSGSLTNATAIGTLAYVAQSNSLVLGMINGVNQGTANTNVGIGTTAPSNIFTIGNGFGHAIADGWDTYSSRRWKTNIQTLHGALEKVEQLRGVSYDLTDSGEHRLA